MCNPLLYFSQAMPEVSYVKALDVWTLACIVFVFSTIVEYIIVLRSVDFHTADKIYWRLRLIN